MTEKGAKHHYENEPNCLSWNATRVLNLEKAMQGLAEPEEEMILIQE
jgi:hypothetical protein